MMGKRVDVELTDVHKNGAPADKVEKSARERRSSADQQPATKSRSNLRHTQSHSLQCRPPTIPTIQETSDEESSSHRDGITLTVPNLARKQSTASGTTVKSNVRDSSRSDKSGRSQAGSTNRGFTETASDGDVVSYQSRYSSNQSLSTQKEQYCCSPNCRFTPRERKLCAVVGVLATIIVILVIVVGVLADQKGEEHTFRWKF